MPYPKEIHEEAHKMLSKLRDYNRQELLRREQTIAKELPKASELIREITGTSAKLVRTIAAGGDVNVILPKLRDENLKKQEELRNLLVARGYTENYLEPIYLCKHCNDQGFVGQQTCSCLDKILKELTYQRLGVPKQFQNSNFDNFSLDKYTADKPAGAPMSPRQSMEAVYRNSINYAENFGLASPSLFMFGDPGLGKTHLSVSIAKRVIEKGFDVMYVPFYQLISRLESAKFGRSDEIYGQLMSSITSTDLLILDDLGTEFPSQFVISTLYDIINTRMLDSKPTIINSNLSVANLEERYTSRIASRISGTYRLARFSGIDICFQNAHR